LQGDKTVTMETKPEIQSHGLHGKWKSKAIYYKCHHDSLTPVYYHMLKREYEKKSSVIFISEKMALFRAYISYSSSSYWFCLRSISKHSSLCCLTHALCSLTFVECSIFPWNSEILPDYTASHPTRHYSPVIAMRIWNPTECSYVLVIHKDIDHYLKMMPFQRSKCEKFI
jgi:hypothetical protein